VDQNELQWLELLIDYKVDPNTIHAETGYSPLMLAAFNNNDEAVRILVRGGANIDFQVKDVSVINIVTLFCELILPTLTS
jgi:ankyrin repeat protein